MDNKKDRQFYWEVKDFMGRSNVPATPAPQKPSVMSSVKNILEQNKLYKQSSFSPNINSANTIRQAISAMETIRANGTPSTKAFTKNIASNPFKVIKEGIFDDVNAEIENYAKQSGMSPSATPDELESQISQQQVKPGVPLTAQQKATRDLQGALVRKQAVQQQMEKEARVQSGQTKIDPRTGNEFSPKPQFQKDREQQAAQTPKTSAPATPATPTPYSERGDGQPTPTTPPPSGQGNGQPPSSTPSQPTQKTNPQDDISNNRRADIIDRVRSAHAMSVPITSNYAEWKAANTARNSAIASANIAAARERDQMRDDLHKSMDAAKSAKTAVASSARDEAGPMPSGQGSPQSVSADALKSSQENDAAVRDKMNQLSKFNQRTGVNRSAEMGDPRFSPSAIATRYSQKSTTPTPGTSNNLPSNTGTVMGSTTPTSQKPASTTSSPTSGTSNTPKVNPGAVRGPGGTTPPKPSGTTPQPGSTPAPAGQGTSLGLKISDGVPSTPAPQTGGQVNAKVREQLGLGSTPAPAPASSPGQEGARNTLGLGSTPAPAPAQSPGEQGARNTLGIGTGKPPVPNQTPAPAPQSKTAAPAPATPAPATPAPAPSSGGIPTARETLGLGPVPANNSSEETDAQKRARQTLMSK
jgi:hypothetical protein